MKNFLAKYGKHFWIVSLFVSIPSLHDFFFKDGDLFIAHYIFNLDNECLLTKTCF
jgi:hypothetical protein